MGLAEFWWTFPFLHLRVFERGQYPRPLQCAHLSIHATDEEIAFENFSFDCVVRLLVRELR